MTDHDDWVTFFDLGGQLTALCPHGRPIPVGDEPPEGDCTECPSVDHEEYSAYLRKGFHVPDTLATFEVDEYKRPPD